MSIVHLDEPGPLLEQVYSAILVPAFPPSEMVTFDDLVAGVRAGTTDVLASLDDAGAVTGSAVGEWSPASGIALLAYLAVRPQVRSAGLGGVLLDRSTAEWNRRWRPAAILAEIEHPAAHPSSPAYGDPVRRLRFYHRHRVRALDVPYFQPELYPGLGRVHGVLLCAVDIAEQGRGTAPDTIDGDRVRRFLVEYLVGVEGAVGTDPDTTALLAALDRPDGVPLLPLDQPDRLPHASLT